MRPTSSFRIHVHAPPPLADGSRATALAGAACRDVVAGRVRARGWDAALADPVILESARATAMASGGIAPGHPLAAAWPPLRRRLLAGLGTGTWRFGRVRARRGPEGRPIAVRNPLDRVAAGALAAAMSAILSPESAAVSARGRGGARRGIATLARAVPRHRFVYRSDVLAYYASIPRARLLRLVRMRFGDGPLARLAASAIRSAPPGAAPGRGIARGCPLSPVLGLLYLAPLDWAVRGLRDAVWVRYVDDWVLLAPTRRVLRRGARRAKRMLAALGLAEHPDKTFIGPVRRGFDFLGHRFSGRGLAGTSPAARRRRDGRFGRLHERRGPARAAAYLARWRLWALSGLDARHRRAMAKALNKESEQTPYIPPTHRAILPPS